MSVHYHPGKVNVVADALGRLSMELVNDVHTLANLGVLLMSILHFV